MSAQIDVAIQVFDEAKGTLQSLANKVELINNTILILSVLTSGGLWALASNVLPQVTAWIGAVASTLVTGLTIYTLSSAIQKRRRDAQVCLRQISKLLGQIRGNPISDADFWPQYKLLQSMLVDVQLGTTD